MSIVCVKVYDDRAIFASDSIIVRNWLQRKSGKNNQENGEFTKLIQTNGMVIGSVGFADECGLFQLYCSTRNPVGSTELDITNFISEFANWKSDKTGNKEIKNGYLIGFKDKVFGVQGYYVSRVTEYDAIGAGEEFGCAALFLGHTPEEACNVACELSIFCEKPVYAYTHYFKDN